MHPKYSRRNLIKMATLGSAALAMPGISQGQMQTSRTLMGTVLAIDGAKLYGVGPQGVPITISIEEGATVWKKTTRQDLSAISAGDRVLVRGAVASSGEFIAKEIWANIASFYGMIVEASGNSLRVLVSRGGGEWSRTVVVDSATLGEGARLLSSSDILVGGFVQTIGLRRPDGTVEATRIIPSVSAAALPPGTIIRPNRQRGPV